jgi:plastocyanin
MAGAGGSEIRILDSATSDDQGKTIDTGDVSQANHRSRLNSRTKGRSKYHCKVHGNSMSGTIIVKAAENK